MSQSDEIWLEFEGQKVVNLVAVHVLEPNDDYLTQTGVYGPDHIWTRPHMDQTKTLRPKHMDQTRPDQTRPDQTRPQDTDQTRSDQTEVHRPNQSRPKYIHQIRLYQRLLNPFSA